MSKLHKSTHAKDKPKQKGNSKFAKWFKGLGAKQASVLIGGIVISLVILISSLTSVIVLSVTQAKSTKQTFANAYSNKTIVGYSAQYLGTVARKIPKETKDEGYAEAAGISRELSNSISGYPKYGYNIGGVLTDDQRTALIRESSYLTAKPTWNGGGGLYDSIDENGYLYKHIDASGKFYTDSGFDAATLQKVAVVDASGNPRQLYKHVAAEDNYLGNVSDSEQAVIKKLTFRPRQYNRGYNLTGLYAPAGEVVKIELSDADMNATGGVQVHVGQALYNGKANNIWTAKGIMNRMPVLLNTLNIDKTTATYNSSTGTWVAYIGNYLGGAIYVRNESVTYSVKISGAVNYSHFILGYTTRAEFEQNAKSTAPVFDLEVWDNGVLHSGPKTFAQNFSYDQIYEAGVLWEKISLVSTRRATQGIVFLYDPFVAAGAAVAFPGQGSVNCPMGWMTSSLNRDAFVKGGAWGNMHEYNHNFQGFGVGYTGEVTNNALNLVEYSLFTKISSARQIGNYGGAGLGGWNSYTSAPWALQRINDGYITSTSGLAVYATLLHNFGQDAFMKSAYGGGKQYYLNWGNNVHYDMSYFASITNTYGLLSQEDIDDLHVQQGHYPMFIPVSCVYQTGRSYNYISADNIEKRAITTMQPYVIKAGEDFTIDLSRYMVNTDGSYRSGSIVVPTGFDYRIVSVGDPSYGKLTKESETIYKYTPNANFLTSGKINVRIELTQAPAGVILNESNKYIDLALEFEQSYELNKWVIERDIYTLSDGEIANTYSNDPIAVLDAINKKQVIPAESALKQDNKLSITPNSSSEIWDPFNLPNNNVTVQANNTLMVLNGKLYIAASGDYRFALRNRGYGALQLSFDGGKTYTTVINLYQNSPNFNSPRDDTAFNLNTNYSKDNPNQEAYIDYQNLISGSWVYFRAVLIVTANNSYIGVGMGQWTTQGFLTETDGDGNIIDKLDEFGNPIIDPDKPPKVNVGYASAYRSNYRSITTKFKTDYFYTPDYHLSHSLQVGEFAGATITSDNYVPAQDNLDLKLENILDGNDATYIKTKDVVTTAKPLTIVADLGKTISASQIILQGDQTTNDDNCGVPIRFTLSVSLDGVVYNQICSFQTTAMPVNRSVTANFGAAEFRYFKLVATRAKINGGGNSRATISELRFGLNLGRGSHISPDSNQVSYKGGNRWQIVPAEGWFGHLYVGQKGATATFKFTGTRFAIISNTIFGFNVEVYIDGNKVPAPSISQKADIGAYMFSYVSAKLSSGAHTITIKMLDTSAIDSFVVWDN